MLKKNMFKTLFQIYQILEITSRMKDLCSDNLLLFTNFKANLKRKKLVHYIVNMC